MSNSKKQSAKKGKAGAVVIAALVVLVAAGVGATYAFGASTDACMVRIQDADGKTYDMPLDENATLKVDSSAGENTIVVENATVRVSEADCPNQDCVHQGQISHVGQQIVCLPHKLVVSVVDASGDVSSDATYDVVGS